MNVIFTGSENVKIQNFCDVKMKYLTENGLVTFS